MTSSNASEDREPISELSLKTLEVRRKGAVLFVEISAPPMNLVSPELTSDLVSLIQNAEQDDGLKVIVFKSADPDYFISHVDVTRVKENREPAAFLIFGTKWNLNLDNLGHSSRSAKGPS